VIVGIDFENACHGTGVLAETAYTAKLEKRQAAGFGMVRRNGESIEVNHVLNVELSAMLDLTDPATNQ
jgi:hypothetical protein